MVLDVRLTLLEIVNDFGLLIEFSNVHQALGELSSTSVDYLIAHNCLPPQVNRLL